MTSNQLAKILIEKFGPLGTGAEAYETYLQIQKGSLPKDIEHTILPGGSRKRYCPYAVAAWVNQHRIPGYYAHMEGK